uniref:Uncharacterized protein n=1 Tax=viral metagenome TaxID=1070528 RepID=A0A6M3XUV9_9ZZZZ
MAIMRDKCGCVFNEHGRCAICDKHASEAWEKRAGNGIGHKRRTATQAPIEARERARHERQRERSAADRALLGR